jgi:hypothetical protein
MLNRSDSNFWPMCECQSSITAELHVDVDSLYLYTTTSFLGTLPKVSRWSRTSVHSRHSDSSVEEEWGQYRSRQNCMHSSVGAGAGDECWRNGGAGPSNGMVEKSLHFFDRSTHTRLLFLKRQVIHEIKCSRFSTQSKVKTMGSVGKLTVVYRRFQDRSVSFIRVGIRVYLATLHSRS